MQCEQILTRLNELMDRRVPLQSDTAVQAHARECTACRTLVGAFEAMLTGMDAQVNAEPSDRFVAETLRTVGQADSHQPVSLLHARSGASFSWTRWLAPVAIAASLLLMASLWWQDDNEPREVVEATQIAPTSESAEEDSRQIVVTWPDPHAWEGAGLQMAMWPSTVRQVASHPEADRIAGRVLQFAEPMSFAWHALLRTLPLQSTTENGALQESDTGFHLHQVDYAAFV